MLYYSSQYNVLLIIIMVLDRSSSSHPSSEGCHTQTKLIIAVHMLAVIYTDAVYPDGSDKRVEC